MDLVNNEVPVSEELQARFDKLSLEELLAQVDLVAEDATITLEEVKEDTGLTKGDIYRSCTEGDFPKPINAFKLKYKGLIQSMSAVWRMREYILWYFKVEATGKSAFGEKWLKDVGGVPGFINKSSMISKRIMFKEESLVIFDKA